MIVMYCEYHVSLDVSEVLTIIFNLSMLFLFFKLIISLDFFLGRGDLMTIPSDINSTNAN